MNVEQSTRIEELYMEMYDRMIAYAHSCLGNEALAEEAVQEAFHTACQRPEKLCGSPNPQGWLVLTLKNTIRNILSSHATTKRILEQYLMSQAGDISISRDRIDVHILYENLADSEEFKLLWELALEGKSHLEMAAARGISISACKKRVQRAREILQEKIEI